MFFGTFVFGCHFNRTCCSTSLCLDLLSVVSVAAQVYVWISFQLYLLQHKFVFGSHFNFTCCSTSLCLDLLSVVPVAAQVYVYGSHFSSTCCSTSSENRRATSLAAPAMVRTSWGMTVNLSSFLFLFPTIL